MGDGTAWHAGFSTEVRAGPVVVEKGIDLEALPVPAVRFAIRCGGDRRVGVTVAEELPTGMPTGNVAFHRDHGVEHWSVFEDGRVVWSDDLAPGEERVTLFGVWIAEQRQIYAFLDPPSIEAARELDPGVTNPFADDAGRQSADDWRPDAEGTLRKHVVDDAAPALASGRIREMVADVERALGGRTPGDGRDDAETAAGAVDPSGDAGGLSGNAGDPSGDADGGPRADDPAPAGPSTGDPVHAGDEAVPAPDPEEVAGLAADCDDRDPPGERYYLRAAVTGTRHGGGSVAVLQELGNALDVLSRTVRESGAVEGKLLDAVVASTHPHGHLSRALAARDQVAGAVVTPLADADGPADGSGSGDGRNDVDPSSMSAGDDAMATFSELQAEVDPVDAADIKDELAETTLPGVDPEDEISMDDLTAAYVDPEDAPGPDAGDGEGGSGEPAADAGTGDGVAVDRLVDGLAAADLDPERRRAVLEAIGLPPDAGRQLDRLRRRVDALERTVDDRPGRTADSEVIERVSALRRTVERLADRLAAVEASADATAAGGDDATDADSGDGRGDATGDDRRERRSKERRSSLEND